MLIVTSSSSGMINNHTFDEDFGQHFDTGRWLLHLLLSLRDERLPDTGDGRKLMSSLLTISLGLGLRV